jgi:mycothiol synthase
MMAHTHTDKTWSLATTEVPSIEGLTFRGFRGPEDYPGMVAAANASNYSDGINFVESVENLAAQYAHLTNSDTRTDVIVAEMAGEFIGYGRVWWQQVEDGPRVYGHFAFLVPEWRGYGIRRAMLKHNEARLLAIAREHDTDAPRCYDVWASDKETAWIALLEQEGYEPARYSFEMARPHLNDIPDLPLPEGLEVRPVKPEMYSVIWSAAREAFRDHWGFSEEEWADSNFEGWKEQDIFTPELWQVAWDGDEVAGMILNFINEKENQAFNRLRGYTETICVRRPYRRKGLARALIARSLQLHRELGMTEAGLGVDAENPNGALQLYKSMGFEVIKQFTSYRKPFSVDKT